MHLKLGPNIYENVLRHTNSDRTPLRRILQVMSVHKILNCYHGNKITQGTLPNLAP